MHLTRRILLAAATAGVTLPATRTFAAPPRTRTSLKDFATDRARAASLRRGVAAMKALDPIDPQSWWWQGSVHHVDVDLVPDFPRDKPPPSQADRARYWNQCPHNLSEEGANEFLGWHTAYLLCFEEVLRAQSGDPNLDLPFWDYGDPAQRAIPAIFADAKVRVNAAWEEDPNGVLRDNPLYEPLRNPLLTDGGALTEDTVDVSWFPAVNDFTTLAALTSEGWGFGFGGGHSPGHVGVLEVLPHGSVHDSLGGEVGDRLGLMASTQTAAFDPIFWVHHANIDRLWRQWLCDTPRNWGAYADQATLDAWFAKKAWPFRVSASGDEVLKPRGAYMRAADQPYVYASQATGCPEPTLAALNDRRDASAVSPRVQRLRTVAQVGANAAPVVVDGPSPATVSLTSQLPATNDRGVSSVRRALADSRPAAPVRLFLDVSGLEVSGYGRLGYNVFVNLPRGSPATRASPHFVGVLKLFGAARRAGAAPDVHAGHRTPVVQTFDVTRLIPPRAENPKVDVTFAPFELVRARAGVARPAGRLVVRTMALRLVRGAEGQ